MTIYTDFDSNAPAGANDPTTYSAADLANLRALRDMAICGRVKDFVMSRTQGTGPDVARPQFLTWINATLVIGFRMNITWGGTGNWQLASVTWQWNNVDPSNGASANWTTMGVAQANTYDGSNNITATANSGGFIALVMELWTKVLKGVSDLAAHIAATGTAVHGLGTAAPANLNAMAITGTSSFDGSGGVGQSTALPVDATRVREVIDNSGNVRAIAAGGTFTADLSTAEYFKIQPSATQTDTMTIAAPSNPPSSQRTQTWKLEIVNGKRSADGKITWNAAFHWIGARPLDTSLEVAGSNLFTVTWNGATYDISHDGKRG